MKNLDIDIDISKNTLITICIIIIVLIIFRCIYVYYLQGNTNNITEGFDINNGAAKDLLSKYKSTQLQELNINTLNVPSITSTSENTIVPWSNKIYNMQNPLVQTRPISFYKPNLSILEQQYYKLGDIVCQEANYTPNTTKDFTLLIKKTGSDVQLPTSFELVVDFGDSNINPNYYQYDKFITDIPSFNKISTSLSSCTTAFSDLEKVISSSLTNIETDLSKLIFDTVNISIGSANQTLTSLITNVSLGRGMVTEPISNSTVLVLASGINGYITTDTGIGFSLTIPKNIDKGQSQTQTSVLQLLPQEIYRTLTSSNIIFTEIGTSTTPYYLFDFVPTLSIINYLISLCNNIKNVYNNGISNTNLLTYLHLASNENDVITILASLNTLKTNLMTYNNSSSISYQNTTTTGSIRSLLTSYISTSTLLGYVINIICNMPISYKMTSVQFTPVIFSNPMISLPEGYTFGTVNSLIITGFNNTIAKNIPSRMFNVTTNPTFTSTISTILSNLTNITNFKTQLNSQSIDYFPIQIYKPIAPDGYTSLGHVFCNLSSDLNNIKNNNSVACIPSHCVKVMRPWVANDKIFEYNKNGVYWAIYYNPYIGTFISTNTPQLPDGSVCKVVACVAKCKAVDDLQKADDCARKYYNLNQKSLANSKIVPDIVSNQEEEFYLQKLRVNSDSITKLKTRAQQMQIDIDKANIVNREMNKNKLQSYVDTQKTNIDIIMKRLIDDNNKIQTNINVPSSVLNDIINMIKNSLLSEDQKSELISKILKSQNMLNNNLMTSAEYNAAISQALNSCPQYDLTGLVRKDLASDVCYGCDVPQ